MRLADHELVVGAVAHCTHFQANLLEHLRNVTPRKRA
jgi:hypothetical protein